MFTAQPLKKDQYICEYLGELISIAESNRRGNLADLIEENYLYVVDEKRNIDAKHIGSLMKFANNSFGLMANCRAKVISSHSHGQPRICLYADRQISAGEELFFDYGFSEEKKKELSWMGAFIKKFFPTPSRSYQTETDKMGDCAIQGQKNNRKAIVFEDYTAEDFEMFNEESHSAYEGHT